MRFVLISGVLQRMGLYNSDPSIKKELLPYLGNPSEQLNIQARQNEVENLTESLFHQV